MNNTVLELLNPDDPDVMVKTIIQAFGSAPAGIIAGEAGLSRRHIGKILRRLRKRREIMAVPHLVLYYSVKREVVADRVQLVPCPVGLRVITHA